jgi:hypothetical protein
MSLVMATPDTPPEDRHIAVIHGGPLDGREYPIFADAPEFAYSAVPNVFGVQHEGKTIFHRLRSPQVHPVGSLRYTYDWFELPPVDEDHENQ